MKLALAPSKLSEARGFVPRSLATSRSCGRLNESLKLGGDAAKHGHCSIDAFAATPATETLHRRGSLLLGAPPKMSIAIQATLPHGVAIDLIAEEWKCEPTFLKNRLLAYGSVGEFLQDVVPRIVFEN